MDHHICQPNLESLYKGLTFSYIGHVGVLNTISLSQTMSLQQPSGTGKESGTHVPKTGEGVRSLQSSGQAQCQLAAIPNSNT